jgi:alpha-1,3-rhamnosyl/mannosyltransferase
LCVDALSPKPGGIGRYTSELCKGLRKREEISQLHYFARGRSIDDPALLLRDSEIPRRGRFGRMLDRRKTKLTLGSSLVHGPNYFLPDASEEGVITVHDLSVFHFPDTHPVERVVEFERRFLKSLARATHIITDTETIRRELIEMFGVRPETVTAVPLGVSDRFRPRNHGREGSATLSRYGLASSRYGLCVSTLEPRKKISELLLAWEQLPKSTRERFPLVLAGGTGWRNDTLVGHIDRAADEGWLRYLGFVDEDDLPALYSGAALFIYPSSYEGFGLPPVEAMASGVPLMVSDRSCLPEVCGEAARYVDPDDASAFSLAIRECLSDEEWRTRSTERGLARAAEFTWSRCVDDTMTVYQHVTRQPRLAARHSVGLPLDRLLPATRVFRLGGGNNG